MFLNVPIACRCSGQRHLLALPMKHHNDSNPRNRGRFIRFVLGITVIVLLAAIAIPNYVRARVSMSMNTCVFNQMWIETAKRRWAAESHKSSDAVPTDAELLAHMRKVTPMWSGSPVFRAQVPSQLPTCILYQRPFPIGSVSQPIQCDAMPGHHWAEHEYRFHYALKNR